MTELGCVGIGSDTFSLWSCFCSLDAGGLLRALTNFSHLAADTIINGSATAHLAPTDHSDRKNILLFKYNKLLFETGILLYFTGILLDEIIHLVCD